MIEVCLMLIDPASFEWDKAMTYLWFAGGPREARAMKFAKNTQKSNHKIQCSTATWDSVPVAPVAAACFRDLMVNGFESCT